MKTTGHGSRGPLENPGPPLKPGAPTLSTVVVVSLVGTLWIQRRALSFLKAIGKLKSRIVFNFFKLTSELFWFLTRQPIRLNFVLF